MNSTLDTGLKKKKKKAKNAQNVNMGSTNTLPKRTFNHLILTLERLPRKDPSWPLGGSSQQNFNNSNKIKYYFDL